MEEFILNKPNMTREGLERAYERRTTKSRIPIDLDEIKKLASISMSQQQVADYFGIGLTTFGHNQDYVDSFNEGKACFAKSILEKQVEIALDDKHKQQTKLLIHLGKVALGQSETQNVNNNISANFEDLLTLKNKLDDQ
jgi:hypothetical protein